MKDYIRKIRRYIREIEIFPLIIRNNQIHSIEEIAKAMESTLEKSIEHKLPIDFAHTMRYILEKS